jgi:2-polyprenyl-3-methyl-5-hydroxy-6-metoxy-1,4-benzoquinol methylase
MKKNKNKEFNYDDIKIGYYDQIYKKKSGIQSAWHNIKFRYVRNEINQRNSHLDIGCGPGTFLSLLKNKRCYGMDIAKKQIKYAKKKYSCRSKIFQIMSKNKIPLRSNSLDSISLIEIIEHLNDKDTKLLILEAYRTLKKGGELIITTPNYLSAWPILELILNNFAKVSYEDQHINKYNIFKIKRIIDKKRFRVKSLKTFMLISPFFAFISFKLSLNMTIIDNFLTKIFPGNLLFLKLKKL